MHTITEGIIVTESGENNQAVMLDLRNGKPELIRTGNYIEMCKTFGNEQTKQAIAKIEAMVQTYDREAKKRGYEFSCGWQAGTMHVHDHVYGDYTIEWQGNIIQVYHYPAMGSTFKVVETVKPVSKINRTRGKGKK